MSIEHLVTSGTFSLDGGTWDVDNNVWIVGDDREVIVIDAAHDADAIAAAVADRRVVAIVCTHGHDDHIDAAPALADRFGAPILLNPAEAPLWEMKWPDRSPDGEIPESITAGGVTLRALVTPGHSPGSTCLYAPDLGTVFSGDTLFQGGPGATGRSYSNYETLISSIRYRLFVLPPDTVVHTGHGPDTTIGTEAQASLNWNPPA